VTLNLYSRITVVRLTVE